MKIYKIRRKEDGLFSSGGQYPSFTKRGKIWNNIGHLKNHLGQDYLKQDRYKGCEIVEFILTETEYNIIDLPEFLNECLAAKAEKQKIEQEKWEKYKRDLELKQLRELKEKYEA